MKFHVILLNGPPQVGKDTLAHYALELEPKARHVKFISNLKHAVATLFNYPIELMEKAKDDPAYTKFGQTIRGHQISVGTALREVYGQDIFGRLLADRLLLMPMQTPFAIISDLGIPEELKPVVSALGKERCSLVRVHQSGRTFDGDCRQYISNAEAEGASCYDVENPKGDRDYAKVFIEGLVQKVRQ